MEVDVTTSAARLAVMEFIMGISHPLPQPLLQVPQHCPRPLQRCRKVATTARRSVRIAVRTWPKGDTQAKARQVLMKKLGILDDEGLSPDDQLLHYFSLFQGPLTEDIVKALTTLSSIDMVPATAAAQA